MFCVIAAFCHRSAAFSPQPEGGFGAGRRFDYEDSPDMLPDLSRKRPLPPVAAKLAIVLAGLMVAISLVAAAVAGLAASHKPERGSVATKSHLRSLAS